MIRSLLVPAHLNLKYGDTVYFRSQHTKEDDGQVMTTKVPAAWTTQWIIFRMLPHAIWLALQCQEMLFARTRTFGR